MSGRDRFARRLLLAVALGAALVAGCVSSGPAAAFPAASAVAGASASGGSAAASTPRPAGASAFPNVADSISLTR